MESNVSLRAATVDDLEMIRTIMNHEIEHGVAVYDYDPKSTEEVHTWFNQRTALDLPVFVAELNDTVVGYASYGPFRPRIGYRNTVELSIYLHHEWQGKGLGSPLMQKLIDYAKRNRVHCMIAGIDSENAGSIAFHEKFGFKQVGYFKEVGFKFDRWLDVVFMQLIL